MDNNCFRQVKFDPSRQSGIDPPSFSVSDSFLLFAFPSSRKSFLSAATLFEKSSPFSISVGYVALHPSLGLPHSAGLADYLDHRGFVGHPVDHRRDERCVPEQRRPLLEGQVGRHQRRLPLGPARQEAERQLGRLLAEADVAEPAEREEAVGHQLPLQGEQLPSAHRLLELQREVGDRLEQDRFAFLAKANRIMQVLVSRICRSETIPDLLRENSVNSYPALFAEGVFPWPPLPFIHLPFITPRGRPPRRRPLLVHQPLDPVGAARDPYDRRMMDQAVDYGVCDDRVGERLALERAALAERGDAAFPAEAASVAELRRHDDA